MLHKNKTKEAIIYGEVRRLTLWEEAAINARLKNNKSTYLTRHGNFYFTLCVRIETHICTCC